MSTATAALADLKVGDRVQVFDVNGRRMGQPEGGWDGTVAKVGRTLIHVNGHQYIKTVEEAAESQHRAELVSRLRTGGVDLRMGHTHTTKTLEALAKALDETAE